MDDDVDVGTDRMQETIEERRRETSETTKAERGRPRWLDYLAISTALFAVFAAAAALESGSYANEALFLANKAVLQQTRAVDAWSEFQADSIKRYEQQNLLTLLPHIGGTPAEMKAATDEIMKRQTQQDNLQKEATARDKETATLNDDAQQQLGHHHRFAVSVTLFQIAIGLAAIAALLRQPLVWYGSLFAGLIAALAFIDGFTVTL